jgi:hypothetical protein
MSVLKKHCILIVSGKNKIFSLPTYPQVKLLSRKGETNNILIYNVGLTSYSMGTV